MSSDFEDEQEEDGATLIAAPSFDELMARREAQGGYDGGTAVEAPSYDALLAQQGGVQDPMAFAQTASGAASYDDRLQAAGLPLPEDAPSEPLTSVPKTMILQPQDWGRPEALPSPASSPAAPAPAPYAPFAPPRPPVAQPTVAARPKSNVMLFLVAAGAGVLIFGTCAAGLIAALLWR